MNKPLISKTTPTPDQPEDVFQVLYDVARLFRRKFYRHARTHGMTRAQWQVLGTISRCQGIRQVQLADMLEIEPITLVRLIDRLEEGKLVERRADPTDRRARTLHLTAAAEPVIAEMREIGQTCRDIGLSGLSQPEQTQLLALLRRVRGNFIERIPAGTGEVAPVKERPAKERSNA